MNSIGSLTILTGLLVGTIATSANAYKLSYTKHGDVIRWFESCVQYTIHEEGVPSLSFEPVREAVRESFDTWENVPCTYFYFEETAPASCDEVAVHQDRGNMNLLVWVTGGWTVLDKEHTPDAIGLTTLAWNDDTGQILDADIEFNADYFEFGLDAEPNKADIINTATHEIGHLLGLAHSSVIDGTMYRSAAPGEINKRDLDPDDIDAVCELYPIDEDPDNCLAPLCGLDLDCSSTTCGERSPLAEDSGCTVATPAPGRLSAVTDLMAALLTH